MRRQGETPPSLFRSPRKNAAGQQLGGVPELTSYNLCGAVARRVAHRGDSVVSNPSDVNLSAGARSDRPAAYETRELYLREWEVAQETTRHFNELLIRLRATALPLTVAAGAAAASISGSGSLSVRPPLPLPAATSALFVVGGLGAALALSAWRRYGADSEDDQRPSGRPLRGEWVFFSLLAFVPVAWALFITLEAPDRNASREIPLAAPVLLAAIVLVTSIYALDRFYYYLLVVGAVRRTQQLEEQLGFELSKTISGNTPEDLTRMVLLFVYVPPILLGELIVGWLVWQSASV